MKTHPAWRYILALKANGIDPSLYGLPQYGGCDTWNRLTKAISDLIEVERCGDCIESLSEEHEVVYQAYRLYKLRQKRIYVETYLLADGTDGWLDSTVGIPPHITKAYKEVFFDTSVFKNGIDKIEYVENIGDDYERSIKREWGRGCDYIKWQMGFSASIDVKDVMTSMLADIYHKHKQAPTHKEASKWCDIALKMGREILGVRDSDGLQDRIEEILSLDIKKHTYRSLEDIEKE